MNVIRKFVADKNWGSNEEVKLKFTGKTFNGFFHKQKLKMKFQLKGSEILEGLFSFFSWKEFVFFF